MRKIIVLCCVVIAFTACNKSETRVFSGTIVKKSTGTAVKDATVSVQILEQMWNGTLNEGDWRSFQPSDESGHFSGSFELKPKDEVQRMTVFFDGLVYEVPVSAYKSETNIKVELD